MSSGLETFVAETMARWPVVNFMLIDRLIPEPERNETMHILQSVEMLTVFLDDFRAAVALFDHAVELTNRGAAERAARISQEGHFLKSAEDKARGALGTAWQKLAGRDGAMQICHLGKGMQALNRSINSRAPTLSSRVDSKERDAALALMDQHFPDYPLIRNAVGHSVVEAAHRPGSSKARATKPGTDVPGVVQGEGVILAGQVRGRSFCITKEGTAACYEVSARSSELLVEVHARFVGAFKPAFEAALRTPHDHKRSAPAMAGASITLD